MQDMVSVLRILPFYDLAGSRKWVKFEEVMSLITLLTGGTGFFERKNMVL